MSKKKLPESKEAVHERLNKEAKQLEESRKQRIDEAREWRELKECTFKPKITKMPNASVMANQSHSLIFGQRKRSNSVSDILVQRDVININFTGADDSYLKKLGQLYTDRKSHIEIAPAL